MGSCCVECVATLMFTTLNVWFTVFLTGVLYCVVGVVCLGLFVATVLFGLCTWFVIFVGLLVCCVASVCLV